MLNLNRHLLEVTYPEHCPKSQKIELLNIISGRIINIFTTDTEGGLVEQVVLSPDNKYVLLGIYHSPIMADLLDLTKPTAG